MNTSCWGPSVWLFLDGMASLYPEHPTDSNKCSMERFVMAMGRTYACVYCRQSSFQFIRRAVIPLEVAAASGREEMRAWFSRLHNDVNAKLKKERWEKPLPPPPTPAEVRRAAAVAMLTVAYNYPETPPEDMKTEDFYRLWCYSIPNANEACGYPLGVSLRTDIKNDPLTEEILTSRDGVVTWTLRRFPEWTRAQTDLVIDDYMRAKPGGCSTKGCV